MVCITACLVFSLVASVQMIIGVPVEQEPDIIEPPPAPVKCHYEGKYYTVGESFKPDPCRHCFCAPNGEAYCAGIDCFGPPCVDAVQYPDQCCKVCPNGPDCITADGKTIRAGETIDVSPFESCSCPKIHFSNPVNNAVCEKKEPPVIAALK